MNNHLRFEMETIEITAGKHSREEDDGQQMEHVVFEMLPINVEPGMTHSLTEYDKRMKRAARFNLDPSQIAGPQAQLNTTIVD